MKRTSPLQISYKVKNGRSLPLENALVLRYYNFDMVYCQIDFIYFSVDFLVENSIEIRVPSPTVLSMDTFA